MVIDQAREGGSDSGDTRGSAEKLSHPGCTCRDGSAGVTDKLDVERGTFLCDTQVFSLSDDRNTGGGGSWSFCGLSGEIRRSVRFRPEPGCGDRADPRATRWQGAGLCKVTRGGGGSRRLLSGKMTAPPDRSKQRISEI